MTKKMAKKKTKTIKEELKQEDFRVAIFGSARIKPDDKIFKIVFKLAKELAKHEFDVVTGGGPGLMEAANAGHAAGDPKEKSDNIGLLIELPWENKGNKHLEIQKEFAKFSNRLDTFIALSNVMVVMPGGIGTCLELFYSWQLVQVGHIRPIPIILVGNMWKQLISWIKKYPLKNGLISPKDLKFVHIAKNEKEAMALILKKHKKYLKSDRHGNSAYLNGK